MSTQRKAEHQSFTVSADITWEEAELKTTQLTLIVKNGKPVFTSQQEKLRRHIWIVYTYQTGEANGQLRYAFQHKGHKRFLTLQDSHVELKPVKEMSSPTLEEKCLFEWSGAQDNKGSLKSVKEHLYLGRNEEKLIACSDNVLACVFEFPYKLN